MQPSNQTAIASPVVGRNPWFSDTETPFTDDEPFFFDEAALGFDWVSRFEANLETIRAELYGLLERDAGYFEPYPKQSMVTRRNNWRTFAFKFWGFPYEENVKLCPKTWALAKDIPGMTAVSFNLLEGGTTIRPHTGDTNAIVRCHMGIDVPASAPACGFRVGDEIRSWEEGKFLYFNDAHEHTAWNNTRQRRFILVIDVMRPEFKHLMNASCSRVLGTIRQEVARGDSPTLNKLFGNKMGKRAMFHFYRALTRVALAGQKSAGRDH